MEEQGPMSSCSFKLAGPSSKEAKYEITAVNVLKDKVKTYTFIFNLFSCATTCCCFRFL